MESEKGSVTTIQNNIISSSSDMDQMEPPSKRNKLESEGNVVLGTEVTKENGKTIEKPITTVSDERRLSPE
jgi:hypothetical protein